MARNAVGSLLVTMGLDASEFVSGTTKAELAAKKLTDRINKQFNSIKADALKGFTQGLVGALSVTAIVAWAKSVEGAAETLKDLSDETGSSVESLSRLANIVKVGGGSFEEFQSNIERLAAGLNGSEEMSTKTAHALQYLGVSTKDPAQAMEQIAIKLNEFGDGAGKAAIARDLFSKGGVRFLASLKDIADMGEISATVTRKQAEDAEALGNEIRKLSNQGTTLANILLTDLVPALSRVIEQFVEGKRIAGGFWEALKLFGGMNPFATPAESISKLNKEIDTLNASKQNLTGLGKALDGALGSKSIDEQIAERKKQLEFAKLLQRQGIAGVKDSDLDARDLKARQKPLLPYTSEKDGKEKVDNTPRLLLEQQLKGLDRAIADEEATLNDREKFLENYFRDDYLSIKDYYGTRLSLIADSTSREVALYDQEIAALEEYKRKLPKNDRGDDERIRVEEKIEDAIGKRTKAERDAATAANSLWFDQVRSAKEYERAVKNVAIQIQELSGDTVGAGLARLQQQQEQDRKRFAAEGNTAATAQLDAIVRLTRAQLELNEAAGEYGRTQERLGIAQGRIDLAYTSGAITELDAINRRSQLARDYIGVLNEQIDAQAKLAATLAEGPIRDDALLRIEQMRLQVDQLAASADGLAKKFNDIFSGAFADAITDFATGAKSIKDIVKDMEKSIVQSISRIASQNIAETLFKKDGALGGIGGFFAKLFGGGDAAGATSTATGAAALTGAGTSLGVSAQALTLAASQLQAAASSMLAGAGSDFGGGLGGLFGGGSSGGGFDWLNGSATDFFGAGGGFYAKGGMPPVGRPSIIGEDGPEVFVPKVAGTVLPNDAFRGIMRGGSNPIVINMPQGTTRASASQVAAEVQRRQNLAAKRNY